MKLASTAVTMLSVVTSARVPCYAANMFVFHPSFVKGTNHLFDMQCVVPFLQNRSNLNHQLGIEIFILTLFWDLICIQNVLG